MDSRAQPVTDATPFLSPDSAASDASAAPGDRVLIHRLAGRDPEALAALYDRHIGAVFSLAARIVEDAAEAGRVVQEVFDQAWSDVERYDGGRMSVGRWLLEMTRSRAIARLRERESAAAAAPDTPVATDAVPDTPAATDAGPDTVAPDAAAPGVPGAAEGVAPGAPGAAPAGKTVAASPAGEAAESAEGEAAAAASEAATLRLPAPAQASAYDVYGPEEADRVRAALAGLPLLQRLGIELAYFEGLTLSQIAGRLEQPPETINARIRSGLERIRTALEDPGE